MRTTGWAVAIAVTVAWSAGAAADDPAGTCVELHCYCDGPDHPDTVASCNTTCEAVCGDGSSSGGGGGAGPAHLARWGLTTMVGRSYASRDATGAQATPAGGTFGVALDGHFGRPSVGILARLALASTPIAGAGVGLARERAWVLDWFDVGLEVCPYVVGGHRWEVRVDGAVWIASTALLGCDGCADAAARGAYQEPGGGWSWGARVGLDVYLGARRRRGLSVAVIYEPSVLGAIGDPDPQTGTATEHTAPTYLVQLGFTSMPDR